MGVRFPGQGTTTPQTTVITASGETLIGVSAPLNIALDFQQVMIFWYMLMTCGTGTVNVIVRLYRGSSTAGTLLNSGLSATATAATNFPSGGCFVDTPGAVAGQQYALSVQQGSGTGGGTLRDLCLLVLGL